MSNYEITLPVRPDTSRGRYGFSIRMGGEFACRALELGLSQRDYNRFQQEGRVIFSTKRIQINCVTKPPYSFITPQRPEKNKPFTGLLYSCSTPSKDHCFVANMQHIELLIGGVELKVLEYKTMAVNNQTDADVLKALWVHWYEEMKKVLGN
jgi:hypothetical protein